MEYQIIHTVDPVLDQATFDAILFNRHKYLKLKDFQGVRCFVQRNETGAIAKKICFANVNDNWLSLPKSPFGGVEYADLEGLQDFLAFVIGGFSSAEKVIVKAPPEIYARCYAVFEQLGFVCLVRDVNHHIDLNQPKTLHPMEMRRFRKAEKSGFGFSRIDMTEDNVAHIHSFISRCRVENGLEINISEDDLRKSVATFPEAYEIFTVRFGTELIAASVTVNVNKRIAYNYLPASLKAYNAFSPMVFLLEKLCIYYRNKGFAYLDLGVSSVDGIRQEGLARFKLAMGAIESEKTTFGLPAHE